MSGQCLPEPGRGRSGRLRRTAWVLAAVPLLAGLAALATWQLGIGDFPAGSTRNDGSAPFHFVDVVDETGISFHHEDGSSGRYYLLETYASGLCLLDHDLDGREDMYFLNGRPLGPAAVPNPPGNALYRNLGSWRFEDVTARAGVGDTGFGLGVCAGDYDNDGDPDLYINNYGPNVLYRNQGDGSFVDVTARAGVGHDGCGAGCAFLDIDRDGDLDLYVAVYLDFSFEKSQPELRAGIPMYQPPERFEPVPDVLYRNNGDGTFTDVSDASGIGARRGWGMGIVAADIDRDGDTDIFVANDVSENFLWINDGRGVFAERALQAGTAFDCNGLEQGSMGVDCADYDHDGHLDFYQTSYATQMPATYHNQGNGQFDDVTLSARSGVNQLSRVTWGCNFGDFDNDGRTDIFVAAGHVQDQIDRINPAEHYRQLNLLYHNEGTGRFREVAQESGPGLEVRESSRGSAAGDLDNDGDLDIVVVNARARPTVLRNDSHNENHWIRLALRGTRSNRDGVGARVLVTANGSTQTAEVHSGRSYQSDYGRRLHFGLGPADRVDRIEVHWPGGTTDVLEDVEADRLVEITEGSPPAHG